MGDAPIPIIVPPPAVIPDPTNFVPLTAPIYDAYNSSSSCWIWLLILVVAAVLLLFFTHLLTKPWQTTQERSR